jgi:hypothetical protein
MNVIPLVKTWFPVIFGVIVVSLAASRSIDFNHLLVISALLSFLGFLVTVFVARPTHNEARMESLVSTTSEKKKKEIKLEEKQASLAQEYVRAAELSKQLDEIESAQTKLTPILQKTKRSKEEKKLAKDVDEELRSLTSDDQAESPAVILGASGIYGIVFGLGITDALIDYTKTISTSITLYFNNTSNQNLSNSLQVVTQALNEEPFEWSYTLRLVGLLVTMLPFVHGAVITFSNKWYQVGNKTHYGLAFIFFIVVFTHAVLFLFIALNVETISLYLFNIFLVMFLNIIWMPIQTYLARSRLEREDLFGNEWTVLNFNFVAFISIFLIQPPNLLFGKDPIADILWINAVILFMLLSRSVSDYAIGWKTLYNRA